LSRQGNVLTARQVTAYDHPNVPNVSSALVGHLRQPGADAEYSANARHLLNRRPSIYDAPQRGGPEMRLDREPVVGP